MTLVTFPPGDSIFSGKTFNDSIWARIDGILAAGSCPDGWLEIQNDDTRLTCLFHQSKPYLAGLIEADGFSWVPLRDLPIRAQQLDGAICDFIKTDPIRVLLLAIHFRSRPVLQASTELVDLAHVLEVLANDAQDAALALEREKTRTLLFLQQGKPARVYFGKPEQDTQQGNVEERFLVYAFEPQAPHTKIEVFKNLTIESDPGAGRSLAALNAEAKPPPPTNVLVKLGGRIIMQRPFMPPSMKIGRDHGCELILDNLSVSRRHARLLWERGNFIVEDLGSANGTTIEGKSIDRKIIEGHETLGVGKFRLSLVEPPDVHYPEQTMLMPSVNILYLISDEQSHPLVGETTIGKAKGVDIRIKGFRVKPLHARIKNEGPGVFHLTSPSFGQVLLNGTPINEAFLKPGDALEIGRTRFRLANTLGDEPTCA
jgi:pSer/pThr/pTyr-binding forkhead associated (FHA) protein